MKPYKRPRYDSDPPSSSEQLVKVVGTLDKASVKQLLTEAALLHPSVADSVNDVIVAKEKKDRAERVVTFDHHLKKAQTGLAKKGTQGKSYKSRLDVGLNLAFDIEDMFNDMALRAGKVASFGTKRNAAEIMLRLLEAVTEANDSDLGRQVHIHTIMLPHIYVEFLQASDEEDMRQLFEDNPTYRDQVAELHQRAARWTLFPNLIKAVKVLDSRGVPYDGPDTDDDEYWK